MAVVDLTFDFSGDKSRKLAIKERYVALKSDATAYTGVVYDVQCDSMQGTYLDLPGHIAETDDGQRADTLDLADFYQMEAAVIHLDRSQTPGGVTAADLEAAYGDKPDTQVVIINALGSCGVFGIPGRSVWLTLDAVEWLKSTPCKLLVSDIYESRALEGVFLQLFKGGISTVCAPDNLHKLTSRKVKLTVMFPKMAVTQVTCSLVAEF